MSQQKSTIKVWLQLFRAPNLFTVPGDPIVGALCGTEVLMPLKWSMGVAFFLLHLAAVSLCFYCCGLLLNDLADLKEDRSERPFRPLPSGAASVTSVVLVAVLLALAGLGLSYVLRSIAFKVGIVLLIAICLYNFLTKHIPVVGQINMGICRGLSVFLGSAAVNHSTDLAGWAVIVITAYITGVTCLAYFETKFPKLPPLIGSLIRALLFIQAAFCALSGTGIVGIAMALVLVALWPISRAVGKKFYAS